MSNKCVITEDKLNDIKIDAYQIGEDFLFDEKAGARERFIDNLYTYIEGITDLKNNDLEITDEDINNIVNAILEGVFENYIEEDDELNFDNIKSKVLNTKRGIVRNKVKESISTENVLRDIEESVNIKERSRKFLDLSYGLAKEVQRQAQLEINTNIFDALFINRGSIKNANTGTVLSNTDLNNNIRHLQQQLLDKICNYLKSRQNLTLDERELIENATLYNRTESGWKNSGVLPQIYSILGRYINPNKVNDKKLRDLYNKSNDLQSKLALDAYNAYVFLKHFDNYLQLLLGKCIEINPSEFGKKSGKDIYKIAGSTSDLATSWRVDENFNPENEIDNITKLVINTTKYYKYGESSPTNRYLTFSNLQNVLGKIKELGTTDLSSLTLMFNEDFYRNEFESPYYDIWKSFSEKTLNLIKNKSLATVINMIRLNPVQNISCIFEILSNQKFRETFKNSGLFKNFISEELDHIYSLHKLIFGEGLRNLIDFKANVNYYQYITQACDAIFKNQFIQYYKDDTNHIKCRVLTDLEISNQIRKFREDVISNGRDLNINEQEFKELYNFNYNENLNQIQFTFPGTPIKVIVNPNSENVSYIVNNSPLINFEELQENKNIISVLDHVLRLGIGNNPDFLSVYFGNVTNPNIGVKQLLDFASNILARQYLSVSRTSKIKPDEKSDNTQRDTEIEKIFGDTVKFSKKLGQIQLISNSTNFLIKAIAKTRFTLNGMSTSTQVKDSLQASQNLQSLSRLLGSLGSQISLIEMLPESVTKNLRFINTPGLFKGHYTTSEYYDPKMKKSKKATKFTVAEMYYANFMSNYVTGLTDSEALKYDHIHGNLVSFLASVNSDKGTIGQLYIDMNTRINYNGEMIPVKDLNISQIQDLIKNDFGVMYSGILDTIKNDYKRVFDYIKEVTGADLNFDFTQDYVNNFELLNLALNNPVFQQFGKNPVEIIKELVKQYNQSHRFSPIELIDQIHLTEGKNLTSNQTLIALIVRFNPNYFNNIDFNKYPTFDQFFKQKEGEVVKDLLKNRFEINLLNGYDKKSKLTPLENVYLSQNYPDWVNRNNGKVILAKVTLKTRNNTNKTFDIISNTDLKRIAIETGLLEKDIINTAIINGTLLIHPELSKYNYLDYFFTQSWMNITVGSFIAHPDKSKSQNLIEQEASRYQALHKRNVSMTAQMHPFLLNTLNGITEEYNVSVIDDIKDFQSTLADLGIKIKPYDGATFVNPFTVYLENNSLGGSRAGFDKKQFVHFKNASTGSGGIIKTAGFAINNDRLRRSPNMWRMMRKMTDITWLTESNNPAILNILQNSLTNNPIVFGDIYFRRKNKYYKVVSMENIPGTNSYTRVIEEVDKNGNSLEERIQEHFDNVDSNFKLWQFFGGATSMTMTLKGLRLSESSIENVAKVMNSVGTLRYKSDGTQYNLNEVETQTEFYQPLKQVDIHYLATAGAVKQGAANINSVNKYNNTDVLDFLRIKMYQAGILLDKEHHADNAELSLPTQIISAAASLGYTFDQAHNLYEGLASAAKLGINDLLEAVEDIYKNDIGQTRDKLTEKVLELIAKNLATGSNANNFASLIATNIREAVLKDPELSYMKSYLPLSDNTVFNKMISTISSHISKQAIKLKIDGLLAVLTPSHELFKIYGNKTFDQYTNPNIELENEQLKLDDNPAVDFSDFESALNQASANVSLERTYKIVYNETETNPAYNSEETLKEYLRNIHKQRGDESDIDYEERLQLETLKEMNRYVEDNGMRLEYIFMSLDNYRKLRDDIKTGRVKRVTEFIKDGRNLGPYNVRVKTKDGSRIFQLWDLDSIRNVHELLKLKEDADEAAKQFIKENNIIDKLQQGLIKSNTLKEYFKNWSINRYGFEQPQYDSFLKFQRERVQRELENLSKSVENKVELFDKLVQSGVNIDSWAIMNLTKLLYEQLPNDETRIDNIRKALIKNQSIQIDGKLYDIDKESLDITAYELIMPKTFINEFFNGEEFIDLDAVKQDEDYFIKQALLLKAPNLSNNNQYDVELKRGDGNHYYLIDEKHLPSTLNPIENEIMTDVVDGKTYRLDVEGNIMYELLPGSSIYTDSKGTEVIVVKDYQDEQGNTVSSINTINKYIESLKYDTVNLSLNLINHKDYVIDLILTLEENKKVGDLISKQVTGENSVICKEEEIEELSKTYKNVTFATPESILDVFKIWNLINESNYKDTLNLNHPIIKAGRIKHSSFLKSLDIVAARIPSLSLLSFMPMKVVAYDNPNRNAAYVSTLLILLQGSD